jgi:serine/threonine-protein kinase RsbW
MAAVQSQERTRARGPAQDERCTVVFCASGDGMVPAGEDLRSFLQSMHVDGSAAHAADVAFEELVGNVVRHGYVEGQRGRIDVELFVLPDRLRLTITDDGKPFDPTHYPAATMPRSAGQWAPGGSRGITRVRRLVSAWSYRRNARRNWNVVEIARASS